MPFMLSANYIYQPYIKNIFNSDGIIETMDSYNVSETLRKSDCDYALTYFNKDTKDTKDFNISDYIIKDMILELNAKSVFNIFGLKCSLGASKINQHITGIRYSLIGLLKDIE